MGFQISAEFFAIQIMSPCHDSSAESRYEEDLRKEEASDK